MGTHSPICTQGKWDPLIEPTFGRTLHKTNTEIQMLLKNVFGNVRHFLEKLVMGLMRIIGEAPLAHQDHVWGWSVGVCMWRLWVDCSQALGDQRKDGCPPITQGQGPGRSGSPDSNTASLLIGWQSLGRGLELHEISGEKSQGTHLTLLSRKFHFVPGECRWGLSPPGHSSPGSASVYSAAQIIKAWGA